MTAAIVPSLPSQSGKVDAHERTRMKVSIIKQLESYLSPDYSMTDPSIAAFLVGGKIAVNSLLRLKRKIIPNRELLFEAVSESSKLSLDSTKNFICISKSKQRNVLILREIPSDTPLGEIKEIFSVFADLPEIKNIYSDIGNNWFVTFYNQDDCMAAALKLSTEGKFKGNALKVRVKANLAKEARNSSWKGDKMKRARGEPKWRKNIHTERNGFVQQADSRRGWKYRQAEQSSFRPPASPVKSYITSPYSTKPTYQSAGYWPSSSDPIINTPSKRRDVAYPPSMIIGSPRLNSFHQRPPPGPTSAPRVSGVADYPGNFRLFSPERIREIIQCKYRSEKAPKPISLNSGEVRDIVNSNPKSIVTLAEAGVGKLIKDAQVRHANEVREESRKRDGGRRKRGDTSRRGGRPSHDRRTVAQGRSRGTNPRKRGGKGRK